MPKITQSPVLNQRWDHLFQIIFINFIIISPYTIYPNFSLLSSIIRFCQNDKGSIFQKSPELPQNPALNQAWDHLFKIFFVRNVISGQSSTIYYNFRLLSSIIIIFQHDNENNFNGIYHFANAVLIEQFVCFRLSENSFAQLLIAFLGDIYKRMYN